ncbi:MAG: hypothetical protein V1679_00785 [Candidatus Peregrinibacteria bacterium]
MKNQIITELKDAIEIVKLNKTKMLDVAGKKSATKWAFLFLLVPPVINLILASLNFPSGFGMIFQRFLIWPMFVPVGAIAGSLILMSFLSKRFYKGYGDVMALFRVGGYVSVILWVSIIPFILAFLGIFDAFGILNLLWLAAAFWIFLVAYQMLIFYHKLKAQDAIVIVIAGVLGYLVLRGVLGRIFVGKYYRLWY